MLRASGLTILLSIACSVGASAAAGAATVIDDPRARELTALDGTVVWVTSGANGSQILMQQDASGRRRVRGAPSARFYRAPDLGRDARGRLVLTYQRCRTGSRCVARRDDLAGRRTGFRDLAVRGCSLSTAPALWGPRAAYGLACERGGVTDARRSGVYLKSGAGAPRRMPKPRPAVEFGVSAVSSVDLRGRRVAAVLADVFSYTVSQDVDGSDIRSFLAGASEGDSNEAVTGLALGRRGVAWSLTQSEHADDPRVAVISRQRASCLAQEVLTSAAVPNAAFPAGDVAVDGSRLLLLVPGTGVVSHAFAAARPCSGPGLDPASAASAP